VQAFLDLLAKHRTIKDAFDSALKSLTDDVLNNSEAYIRLLEPIKLKDIGIQPRLISSKSQETLTFANGELISDAQFGYLEGVVVGRNAMIGQRIELYQVLRWIREE
jgi:hypothetical protein